MANIQQLTPILFKREGGYVNNPADLGDAVLRDAFLPVVENRGAG